MLLKFIITICSFLLINTYSFSQSGKTYVLNHLSPQDYQIQIKACTDSAFLASGFQTPQEIHLGNSYNWLIPMIEDQFKSYLKNQVVSDKRPDHLIYYRITWERINKDLFYNLSFIKDTTIIGKVPFLYAVIKDDLVTPIILFRSKKEVNKIAQDIFNK